MKGKMPAKGMPKGMPPKGMPMKEKEMGMKGGHMMPEMHAQMSKTTKTKKK